MKQNNSILLPGTFFEADILEKVNMIINKDISTIYFYDHPVNPLDSKLPIYKITEDVFKLFELVGSQINIGTCVLNVNSRSLKNLFENFIYPLLEIEKFKLGLGIGDNKYKSNQMKFSNNIEEILSTLLSNYSFGINQRNLFLGGNSSNILSLAKKYSLGLNQWFGTELQFEEKINIYSSIKEPLGLLSRCVSRYIDENLNNNYEKIILIRDSDPGIFLNTLNQNF